jgi:hypothetical protein
MTRLIDYFFQGTTGPLPGPSGTTVNGPWIEAKRLWVRPADEAGAGWVRSISTTGPIKLINKLAPDVMTQRYTQFIRPSSFGWSITTDYVFRFVLDDEQYTRDYWLATVNGSQAEKFVSAVGLVGGEFTHQVAQTPAQWLDAGVEFSLIGDPEAKAKARNITTKVIPVDTVAAHTADVTLADAAPDSFLYGATDQAVWVYYHLNDTETTP